MDKLNKGYVKAYFDNYLDQYKDATGGLMGKRGLQYVITDSWEAGVANWTDDMIAEFAKRRGYDMKPWLPALAGRIVESAEATDRFLWDFRKTLSELTAEYHYDQLTDLLDGARHGALHRVARIRPRVHRRRHGGQGQGRHPHERDVDRGSRAAPANGTTPTSASRLPSRTSTARTSWPPSRSPPAAAAHGRSRPRR